MFLKPVSEGETHLQLFRVKIATFNCTRRRSHIADLTISSVNLVTFCVTRLHFVLALSYFDLFPPNLITGTTILVRMCHMNLNSIWLLTSCRGQKRDLIVKNIFRIKPISTNHYQKNYWQVPHMGCSWLIKGSLRGHFRLKVKNCEKNQYLYKLRSRMTCHGISLVVKFFKGLKCSEPKENTPPILNDNKKW